MKTISLDVFNEQSINAAIAELNAYGKGLEKKAELLCERLANLGYEVAFQLLSEHVYSGETISSLQVIEESPNRYILQAGSVAILFLEFGAGIHGGGHPLAGEFGMGPGTYPGQTHAFDPGGWWFPTDDANLAVRTDKDGQMWGHSYGNPPYMPMYNTAQDLRREVEQIAREVFST